MQKPLLRHSDNTNKDASSKPKQGFELRVKWNINSNLSTGEEI